MILGIDHVGMTVPDLDQAIAFLSAAFGCKEITRIGPFAAEDDWMQKHLGVNPRARIPEIATLALGNGARIEVFAYETLDQSPDVPANSDIGAHHVAFYTDDMTAALSRVVEAGGNVMGEPTVMTDGPTVGETWIYVRAPWGGQFELITR